MIIIVQKYASTRMYYEFTDLDSGTVRRWSPSKRLCNADLKKAFEMIAKTMHYSEQRQNPQGTPPKPIVATKEMTFFEFCEKVFLPRKIITIAENTRDRWVNSLDTRIYPELGEYRMCEINAAVISDFLLSLQAVGLAQSTVNRFYTILQSILKMAFMMDIYDRNPMEKVERPRARKDELIRTTPEAYTAREIVHIMDCLENEPTKYRAMVMLMSETGMRRGECLGLKWEHIDLANGTVEIRGSIYYTKKRGIYYDTPKNKKPRVAYISPLTVELLQEMDLLNFATVQSEFVFTQAGTALPMHPHTPTKQFSTIGKTYQIDHFHPHKLRHSFASIAITHGADPVSVAELMGHRNTEILFRHYTNSNVQSMKKAVDIYHQAIDEAKEK